MSFEAFDFDYATADGANPGDATFGDATYDYSTQADLRTLQGDGNSAPVQSDTTVSANPSALQVLGGIGTTARDLGTAAGAIKRDLTQASANFNSAYNASASGNKLATWWQYASTTDKLMVGLAVVGIIVALKD